MFQDDNDIIPSGVNSFWYAMCKFRERNFEECANVCSTILDNTPNDQAVWLLKCRALTMASYLDESEIEDEGIGDILLDENATSNVPRPGTSIQAPTSFLFFVRTSNFHHLFIYFVVQKLE